MLKWFPSTGEIKAITGCAILFSLINAIVWAGMMGHAHHDEGAYVGALVGVILGIAIVKKERARENRVPHPRTGSDEPVDQARI